MTWLGPKTGRTGWFYRFRSGFCNIAFDHQSQTIWCIGRFCRDNEQILRFIHNVKEFSNFNVNHQEQGKGYPNEGDQLRNLVSRGLATLEHIFYIHDGRKNNIDSMKLGDYIEINIVLDKNPKLINIGKGTSEKKMNDLINLVKEYRDVFAFTYDELKAY